MKLIILMVLMGLFVGCSEDVNTANDAQSSSITPQPSVDDDSIRPPKPPSI